jgi:hypothetical protein
MADNFTKAEPSRVMSRQDHDGYARELYTLRESSWPRIGARLHLGTFARCSSNRKSEP